MTGLTKGAQTSSQPRAGNPCRLMAENDTSWFQEDHSWRKKTRHGKKMYRVRKKRLMSEKEPRPSDKMAVFWASQNLEVS